jgi:pimeloyl-ACP methyl ester carboxylesterase
MFWSLFVAGALASPVTLTTSDGVALYADAKGKGERGVLLLHADGRSHTDWQFFAEKLSNLDFNTLALDLRGHGKSSPKEVLEEADYLAMPLDVETGINWLSKQGVKSITIVGAELGALAGLSAAADNKAVANMLLLSPHLSNNGLKVSTALLERYGDRPVLMAAGIDDAKSVKAASLMESKFTGKILVEIVVDGGEGVELLNRSPGFEGLVISWLNQAGELQAEGSLAGEERLQSGEVEEIKTTGTSFYDR